MHINSDQPTYYWTSSIHLNSLLIHCDSPPTHHHGLPQALHTPPHPTLATLHTHLPSLPPHPANSALPLLTLHIRNIQPSHARLPQAPTTSQEDLTSPRGSTTHEGRVLTCGYYKTQEAKLRRAQDVQSTIEQWQGGVGVYWG